MPQVQLFDQIFGGVQSAAWELAWNENSISARDLIASRVEEEVARHNARLSDTFFGFVQPEESERLLNGFRLKAPRRIDANLQIERALRAFESNGFFLLVNDRQIESLDELIHIELETRVAFVKLVALQGG